MPVSKKLNVAQSVNSVVQRLRLLKGSSLDAEGIRAYLHDVQEEAEPLKQLVLTPAKPAVEQELNSSTAECSVTSDHGVAPKGSDTAASDIGAKAPDKSDAP